MKKSFIHYHSPMYRNLVLPEFSIWLKKSLLLFLVLFWLVNGDAQKPFKRSLILPGGGFKMAMHLGSYHAMLQAGLEPDLIIGTCGGGLTAGIIEMFPDQPEAQLEFLLSPKVHRSLLEIHPTRHAKLFNFLYLIFKAENQGRKKKYLRKFILDVPQNLSIFDDSCFTPKTDRKSFATIIQSTEMVSGKESNFFQVFFTDPNTAEMLDGYESKLGHKVKSEIIVISEFFLKEAVRASITDPFLMAPFTKEDRCFLTGAVDVLPFELTGMLSSETFFFFKNDLQSLLDRFFKATFGFKMMDKVLKQRDHQADMVTDSIFGKDAEIDPGVVLFAGIIPKVPYNYKRYREVMLRQYHISLARSLEILQQQKGKNSVGN